jgi:preprotein translocase subunit SecD
MRNCIIAALIGIALLAQGCSEFEPRHGTKVTFAFDTPRPIRRDQLAAISKYLIARGRLLLGVKGPRVEDYSDRSLVLLLPGQKVRKGDVEKLIHPYSIELYHLTNVATQRHPNRPWKITLPADSTGPYLFVGPKARLIDSHKDPAGVRDVVLGHPKSKPVLTGRDILPTASLRQIRDGWAVLVRFDEKASKTFYEFTRANAGEYLAVFYNGRLVSAPIIKQSIPGGEALITGFAKENQAHALVSELNAGQIPMRTKITKITYY